MREPVHGGHILNLHQIFRSVVHLGGYEKVCSDKKWKVVIEPYDFPATATNSSYVVKNIYQKYLYPYEAVVLRKEPIEKFIAMRKAEEALDQQSGSAAPRRSRMNTGSQGATPAINQAAAMAHQNGTPAPNASALPSRQFAPAMFRSAHNPDEDGKDGRGIDFLSQV